MKYNSNLLLQMRNPKISTDPNILASSVCQKQAASYLSKVDCTLNVMICPACIVADMMNLKLDSFPFDASRARTRESYDSNSLLKSTTPIYFWKIETSFDFQ